ncbi:uncharacterized protein LOC105701052 [Orussus abietinus]|uniref:uncharacterized protein LOC105701052 n=1 Tax=Orussus abietinus TaxID=222816 RepID=UPI0006264BA1|nr:uncharacterized protein LOC105701052 [Orussus abietinus]
MPFAIVKRRVHLFFILTAILIEETNARSIDNRSNASDKPSLSQPGSGSPLENGNFQFSMPQWFWPWFTLFQKPMKCSYLNESDKRARHQSEQSEYDNSAWRDDPMGNNAEELLPKNPGVSFEETWKLETSEFSENSTPGTKKN